MIQMLILGSVSDGPLADMNIIFFQISKILLLGKFNDSLVA